MKTFDEAFSEYDAARVEREAAKRAEPKPDGTVEEEDVGHGVSLVYVWRDERRLVTARITYPEHYCGARRFSASDLVEWKTRQAKKWPYLRSAAHHVTASGV